jgi:tetratricopeptide (TPR) repeat protein
LAQMAFTQKKYDESLALLENVFSRDGANFEAGVFKAEVWLAKGEIKQALESLERLDKAYPNVPIVKYQLARAYLLNNDLGQATVVLNQAVARNPDFTEAILLLGEVKLRAGDAQTVVDSMNGLLKKRPDLMQAQTLLAAAYQSLGRLDDAADVFRNAIRVSPENAEARLRLGLILREQEKIADARDAFEKASTLEPENVQVLQQLVELDILNKDFNCASERVRRHREKASDSAAGEFLEGQIYAAEDQRDRAKAALLRALQLDPGFSSASDLLISTYIASNQLTEALGQLQGVLSKNPNNVRMLISSALVYEKMRRFSDARDAYEKVLSVNPDFLPALKALASLYAKRLNELDRAYDLARKARSLGPEDAEIGDTLGWIFYERTDYEQALTLLNESTAKCPDNPEMQFHLGMAHYMMGHTEAARTALRRAGNAPWDFPGKEMIAPRLALLGDGSGKLTELSSDELEKILQQQPDDIVARIRLGEFYESQGAIGKANAAYEQALEVNPRLLSAIAKLAELNAGPLANTEKAMEFARKARKLAPDDPRAAGILGSVAYKSGDFTEAYSLLSVSARQASNDAGILHDLAWAAYSLGKVSEAQQTMQRVLQASPDARQSEDAKTFLAMTAFDQNNLATSEPDIEKLLRAAPDYVPALIARAAIQEQRGESRAAAATFDEVLRRFPDFTPALKHLASLYVEDPDHIADAYDLAMKARRTLPDDPELAQVLAEISYKRKQFAYALQLLQESAKKRPLNATYLYYLGMCHWQLKEKSQSQDALGRALAAGLQEPLLTDARDALAQLHRE